MDKNYITDEQVVKRANIAVKLEIEKKKAMDIPIALYDSETQSIYQENSDGTREVVAKRLREGRYSERISKKPEIIVFAGPNGSGKSTFTELLKPNMDYINADEIQKSLKCSNLEAAQLAEKQRKEHLDCMEEFCFAV